MSTEIPFIDENDGKPPHLCRTPDYEKIVNDTITKFKTAVEENIKEKEFIINNLTSLLLREIMYEYGSHGSLNSQMVLNELRKKIL